MDKEKAKKKALEKIGYMVTLEITRNRHFRREIQRLPVGSRIEFIMKQYLEETK